MKQNYLFENRYKKWGWLILVPSFIAGCIISLTDIEPSFLDISAPSIFITELFQENRWVGMVENNILNEIVGLFLMIGLVLVAFSKEKEEDELILKIRLESLVWATYVNYAILFLAIMFIYSLSFFKVMVFNMYTLLIFFVIRFYWQKGKLIKLSGNEE